MAALAAASISDTQASADIIGTDVEAPSRTARPASLRHLLSFAVIAIWSFVAIFAPPVAAQVSPAPTGEHPVETSRAISQLIAARDAQAAAGLSARTAGEGEKFRDQMLTTIQPMKSFGTAEYLDRVYERPIGSSTYDIIDKLNFEKSVIFVRYLFYVERGEWRLGHFTFKSEASLPLPREWVHIYPDGLVGARKP